MTQWSQYCCQDYIIEETELSREVKLVHSDNTGQWQSQDTNAGSWSPESMRPYCLTARTFVFVRNTFKRCLHEQDVQHVNYLEEESQTFEDSFLVLAFQVH